MQVSCRHNDNKPHGNWSVDESRIQRKLAAIFSADVAGYSRLMRNDESATVATLTEYRKLMTELIHQHKGRVVDMPGDNMLAEFSSVVDAVQSAVAIQRELRVRNAKLPDDRKMAFRIGINIGDVIQEEDRIYGDGVNIAARLESIAEPGGICISRSAFDQIESKLPFGYTYLGEQTAKNIDKPLYAYRVLLDPENIDRQESPFTADNMQKGKRSEHASSYAIESGRYGNRLNTGKGKLKFDSRELTVNTQQIKKFDKIKKNIQDRKDVKHQEVSIKEKITQGVLKSKQARFLFWTGLSLICINGFTSFGDWWFQWPLLWIGLILYIVWINRSFSSSRKITELRERIFNEEMDRIADPSKPTGKEIEGIERRIKRSVGFYRHLYIFSGVNLFLILLNLATTPLQWWFQYSLISWGFFLLLNWLTVKKYLHGQVR